TNRPSLTMGRNRAPGSGVAPAHSSQPSRRVACTLSEPLPGPPTRTPGTATYEYVCSKCDQHREVYQSFSEEPLKRHSGCGGKLTKGLGSVRIVLTGSGFY